MVKLLAKEEIYNRFREKVKLAIIDDFFFSRSDLIIELILLSMSKRLVANLVQYLSIERNGVSALPLRSHVTD